MNETVTFVVGFLVTAVILFIGVSMLGQVNESAVIQDEIIPAGPATLSAITGGPSWFENSTSVLFNCRNQVFSNVYKVVPPAKNGTNTFEYFCGQNVPPNGLSYTIGTNLYYTTNDKPTFTSTCPGQSPVTRDGFWINQTPTNTRGTVTISGNTGTFDVYRVIEYVESNPQRFQIERPQIECTETAKSAWGEVQAVYDSQTQSSYALLMIILIVIAAVVILFVLRYLY